MYVYVFSYTKMHNYVCMYVHVHVYRYIYVYTCMYICIPKIIFGPLFCQSFYSPQLQGRPESSGQLLGRLLHRQGGVDSHFWPAGRGIFHMIHTPRPSNVPPVRAL